MFKSLIHVAMFFLIVSGLVQGWRTKKFITVFGTFPLQGRPKSFWLNMALYAGLAVSFAVMVVDDFT